MEEAKHEVEALLMYFPAHELEVAVLYCSEPHCSSQQVVVLRLADWLVVAELVVELMMVGENVVMVYGKAAGMATGWQAVLALCTEWGILIDGVVMVATRML